jgi:ATP-dependent Clp protease adaptor protein ClpS
MKTNKQDQDPSPSGINKNESCSLLLYNDDYHTHDYVIDALVQICGHDLIQATQCSFLVHFKEKCEIKRGPKEILMPMQRALIKKDLKVSIK